MVLSPTQNSRLADILIFGPLIAVGGWKLQKDPDNRLLGQTLVLTGIGTILFTGYNYLQVKRGGS